MSETNDKPDITDLLQWIGTTLEKNNDVLMMILNEANSEQAELVDFIHNKKFTLMNELTEDQLTELSAEYREQKYEK